VADCKSNVGHWFCHNVVVCVVLSDFCLGWFKPHRRRQILSQDGEEATTESSVGPVGVGAVEFQLFDLCKRNYFHLFAANLCLSRPLWS
jgi:hypothetical protein